MLKFLSILFLLLAAAAMAQEGEIKTWTNATPALVPSFVITQPNPYPDLVVTCGDGSVTISTKDGSVKYDRCEPDEGARAFWEAITRMFPGGGK